MMLGKNQQSTLALQTLQHLAQLKDTSLFVILMTKFTEAWHYQFTGEHEKCLKSAFEGLQISENSGILTFNCHFLGHAILSCQNRGDLETAQSLIDRMGLSLDRFSLIEKGHYYVCLFHGIRPPSPRGCGHLIHDYPAGHSTAIRPGGGAKRRG
ncbi:MAG TPA: hypothetical protein VK564_00045, partial [Thermodesulfobacteriota bacterium]|nr:hypothetical protein [Thermodesulfobacteriota bacterium]